MIKVIEKLKAVNNGGIEAFVFKNTFLIKNNDLEICYYSDKKPADNCYDKRVSESGRRIDVSEGCEGSRIKKLFCFAAYCRKKNVGIAHIHMSSPIDFLSGAAAKLYGVKRVIFHSHSGDRPGSGVLKKTVYALSRLMMRAFSSDFLACSEAAGRYMFGKKSRFTVVKNGMDTAHFGFDASLRKETRDKLGIGDKMVIGHVARLCEIKNQRFLVDVFDCVHKMNPDTVLLIAGEGDYRKKIEKRISELGLEGSVIFAGSVEDPAPYYCAMDIFVLPSLSEGISIVAIEAQTSGLPAVCSDGVPREAAVTELCSFMPLNASAEKWAEHILEKVSAFERRSYAEEVKSAGYDIADTARQLEEIYFSFEN